MLKLVFFVPESHLDEVKNAVFSAGAGRMGQYDQCSWQVLGQGQFQPLAGSTPFLGDINKLAQVSEWRVEMVCTDGSIAAVQKALLTTHPYETPAYEVIQLLNL